MKTLRPPRTNAFCLALAVAISSPLVADDAKLTFFETKVRPLLVEHCYECHSEESGESSGELRLDSAPAIQRGGSMGPALVAGKPDASLLYQATTYNNADLQMPPSGKLDQADLEVLRKWIQDGAVDPRETDTSSTGLPNPMDREPQSHWAFVPPQHSTAVPGPYPKSEDVVDEFATSVAKSQGLSVSEEAAKEELIRRLYFDLTGIPPSFEEITRFANSNSPASYSRLVDRLLASPEFAERFGRHWLDVARYADTVGYALAGREREIKGSYRYRDWVIRAFGVDMPFDEMIRHQLNADRTDPENAGGNLDAMGFLTVGRKFLNPLDTLDDQIDVVSRGLLGLTVSCARCHDHKFDPIPTSDYYSLFGILSSSKRNETGPSPLMVVDKKNPHDAPILVRGQAGNRGEIAPRQFLTSLRSPNEARFSDGSGRKELAERIATSSNPLTSRVMVNRIWGHLIGRPLVDSPSDFGYRTDAPAVPQVLDDLAADFSTHWSIKKLVRRIVHTRIYRQSSSADRNAGTLDPENRFLARANRKRRDFESMRDSILVVSGSLDRRVGGPSVELTLATPSPRRTVYGKIDRQNLPALFRTFDFASPDTHSPKRYFTTVPQQALFLLNNRQIHRLSADASRHNAVNHDTPTVVQSLFRQILSREPSPRELKAAVAFLNHPASPTLSQKFAKGSLWSYGTGKTDEKFKPTEFVPFPVFTESRWQAGDKFPLDGDQGYANLGTELGHTPRGKQHAVIRRWSAPQDGTVRILGQMGHRSKQGDGVQATIFVGNRRIFNSRQKSNNRPFGPLTAQIKAGDHVQVVFTPGDSDSFDTFYCKFKIKLTTADNQVLDADSVGDFGGPKRNENLILDRPAQLAQTLMLSNEFLFVD